MAKMLCTFEDLAALRNFGTESTKNGRKDHLY